MQLSKLNFRLVLPQSLSTLHGLVYRSNSLDDGCVETVRWLSETIGIRTYVELREKYEFNANSKLDQYFPWRREIRSDIDGSNDKRRPSNRYHIRFFTTIAVLKSVLEKLSLLQLLIAVLLLIRHLFTGDSEYKNYCQKCLIQNVDLETFYCLMLRHCPTAFRDIFSLLKNRENFPILISCTMGKDRTGVVCALLMKLAGCSDEDVINEYAKTEILLKPMENEINGFFENRGVKKEFKESQPKTMKNMLRFLKEKYGGVEGYLLRCGLSRDDIAKIKRNIQPTTINH